MRQIKFTSNKGISICALSLMAVLSFSCLADGGVSIRGTRVIYPAESRQQSVTVSNSSKTDSFLVQSWIDDASGKRSQDFTLTPPLYLSAPDSENALRLMRLTGKPAPDRESLYYLTVKAIPSVSDKKTSGNTLRIATATRIKLLVRPAGLTPSPAEAPEKLVFSQQNGRLRISNPTPYYLTLTDMRAENKPVPATMVAPRTDADVNFQVRSGTALSYHTINDYGAVTAALNTVVR